MKPMCEMSEAELIHEMDVWLKIIQSPKGPGTPSNTARSGAEQLYQQAAAWKSRRALGL